MSKYNALDNGRYYDFESASSFAFDQITQVRAPLLPLFSHCFVHFLTTAQKASATQSYTPDSAHTDLM